jgi:hypothetical protein
MKATPRAVGKDGFGGVRTAEEANAAKRIAYGLQELLSGGVVEVDTELGKSGEGIRHETFAASLIDRGLPAVSYFDMKALTGCRDGTR